MQILLNGLVAGLAIATLALAFAVVYLPTRVFHVAAGAIYTVAPFVAWTCLQGGWHPFMAFGAGVAAGTLLSALCEHWNHAHLERQGASATVHLISSLGIFILLVQAVALVWGTRPKVLRSDLDSAYRIGDAVLTGAQLTIAAVGLAAVGGFFVWVRFGRRGLQLRGLAENSTEMALRGYNVDFLRLGAFILSGVLASSVGVAVAFDIGFDPHVGLRAVVLAAVATIIGGTGSFAGPVVAGLLLGLLRSTAVWFLSARWEEVITFMLLAAFLLLRPEGITGTRMRLEESL